MFVLGPSNGPRGPPHSLKETPRDFRGSSPLGSSYKYRVYGRESVQGRPGRLRLRKCLPRGRPRDSPVARVVCSSVNAKLQVNQSISPRSLAISQEQRASWNLPASRHHSPHSSLSLSGGQCMASFHHFKQAPSDHDGGLISHSPWYPPKPQPWSLKSLPTTTATSALMFPVRFLANVQAVP